MIGPDIIKDIEEKVQVIWQRLKLLVIDINHMPI